jgi:hypothetical protein
MDKMVTRDLESQDSNDGGTNGSRLVATTILHPMVRDLAFSGLKQGPKSRFEAGGCLEMRRRHQIQEQISMHAGREKS